MGGRIHPAQKVVECPLLARNGPPATRNRLPLLAKRRHSTVIPTAWILRSLVVSLLGEGESAWNAGLLPFLPQMSLATLA